MIKKLLFIFSFICLISNGFSYVNVSSCQVINEAVLDVDREVRLNKSIINVTDSYCFVLTNSNYVFDCQNNLISGYGGNGFLVIDVNNITLQNCIMDNQALQLDGFGNYVNNSNFINITMSNLPVIAIASNEEGV
jgi:hypothetical protein